MLKNDTNKIIDKWVEEQNRNAGEEYELPIGLYPPDRKSGVVCVVNNELITADLIRHYADAIGDKNPLWRSKVYAGDSGWKGIIAPPTITDCISPGPPAGQAGTTLTQQAMGRDLNGGGPSGLAAVCFAAAGRRGPPAARKTIGQRPAETVESVRVLCSPSL